MSIEKTSIEFLDAELAIAKLELEMDDGDRGDESREAFMFWRGVKAAQKLTEIIQS